MHGSSVSFLKDILPILISSIALIVSVFLPYLLIRYEKIYNLNRDSKEFLRQVELLLLEWLNITAHNARLSKEFLEVLKTAGAIFPKTFQFYDFPNADFFKSYNIELVNEFYVINRKLKDINHHLQMIDKEYGAVKMIIMGGGKLATNSTDFFKEANESVEKGFSNVIEEMTNLRIRVRLLLKQANQVDGLKINRFFAFSPQSRFWYKKDMRFTEGELQEEKTVLEKEKETGAKQP